MISNGLRHWGDITVVIVYFGLVLLVGVWSLCRRNRGTVPGYFLAGRSMAWIPVGASLFSSNIGSEHFVGLAGTGAASGMAIVLYEWLAMPLLIVLAWLFVPVYISAGVYTMPEYMERRFGGSRIRLYLSFLAVVLYIVTKLAVSIFAGALFIMLCTGWNMYLSIAVLLVVTGLFTILGGLAAVIYTDTLQTAVMIVGALVLTGLSFEKVGGYENLQSLYMNATPSNRDPNSTCGVPRADAFNVLRHPVTSDNPWPGLVFHILLGCLWYFCCDQVIVQRSLAAKSLLHAKAGSLLSGYLKILPMFIMVLPGMISRALYPDEIACVEPDECMKYCGNPVGCSNIAYPKLVLELLPAGLRGLLMAVMLSAIMSSLTSIFNSASTLFAMDLWPKVRKTTSPRELLIVGRIFIVVLAAISILWIPLVQSSKSGQLFVYIQAVQGYLGTPLGPVFILAIFWKRTTEKAVFWSLVLGHLCGLTRMIMDFSLVAPNCGEPETRPEVLYRVHYTYFGIMLFVITSACVVIISYCTEPVDCLEGLTWWTKHSPESNVELTTYKPVKATLEIIFPEKEKDEEDGKDDSNPEEDQHQGRVHSRMSWLYKLCGIPESAHDYLTPEVERAHRQRFLQENPFWKNVVDFNAVLGILVIVFLLGYFH